jgi:hypothetical protein
MRSVIIGSALSLALAADLARAQAGPDPQAVDLAKQIVAIDADRAQLARLDAFGQLLPPQIEALLNVEDPAQKQKIADLVKARLTRMEDGLSEARATAMAQTYPADVLQGALAFRHTSTGEAFSKAAPALNEVAGAALLAERAAAIDPAMPAARRALIERVLRAQDVEGTARRGWKALSAMLGQGAAQSAQDAQDESNYVARVVAAETQFYAQTYTDAQLADLAAYVEGPVGTAFKAGQARLQATSASLGGAVLEHTYDHFGDEICGAVPCTPAQKAQLDDVMGKIQSAITSVVKSLSQ